MSVGSQLPLLLAQQAHVPDIFNAEAVLGGVGTVVPDGRKTIALTALLDGAGTLGADAQAIEGPVVQLGGTGTLGATSRQTLVASATLGGAGGFTGSTTTLLNATLVGSGSVGASTTINRDTYRSLVWSAAPIAYWRLAERLGSSSSTGSPAFRASVAVTPGGGASSYSITIPGNVQVGDMLLLAVATTTAATHSTPSGWTLLNSSSGGGTYGCRQSIFWRVAQLGDAGTSVTCTISSSGNLTLVMSAYSGVATINVSGASTSSGDSYPVAAPSVTTTVDGCYIVEFFAILGVNYTTLAYPAVQRANVTTGYSTSGTSDHIQVAAGATGQQTAATDYPGSWVGHTIALAAPLSGGAPPTVAQDEMGHYNGAYVEPVVGATSAIRGSGNGAVTFDGAASYVALGNPLGLRITGAFTVEAWFKTSVSSTQAIVGSYPKGYRIYVSSGTVYGQLWSSYYASWVGMGNATVASDGRWHYVAFSYDGSGVFRVFVDDGPGASSDYGVALAVQHDPSGGFAIGRRGDAAAEFLNGSVDEVAIYNRYLTEDELKSHGARRLYQTGWSWGPNLGINRAEAGICGDGYYLYVMGGYYGGSRSENEVYLPQYNIWTFKAAGQATYEPDVAAMPSPPAPTGGHIYHAGGSNTTTTFRRYSINSNTWTDLPTMPVGDYAGQLVAVPPLNKLFLLSYNYTNVYVFDVATNAWTTSAVAALPTQNYAQRACYYAPNGKIYLHRAYSLYEFDPITYVWTTKASSIGYFSSGHAFVSYNNRIWAIGGTDASGQYSRVSNSYDPVTNTWRAEDSLLSGTTYFGGGVVANNTLMVASGNQGTGSYGVGGNPNRSEIYKGPAVDGQTALSVQPTLMPYPLGRAALEIDLGLEGDGEKVGGTRGLTAGPVRVTARDPRVFLSGQANGVSALMGRFPGPLALEGSAVYSYSSMTGALGPIWTRVIDSQVPLPAADAADIFVGTGDQTVGVDSVDEYAYATSADGRYFYLMFGYWWHSTENLNWDQWWSNRAYRWDALDQAWTELAHPPGYVGSEGACGGMIGDKMYVLQGDADDPPFGPGSDAPDPEYLPSSTTLQSMWVYDTTNDTWTRGTQPPFSQDYGGCAVIGTKLYVVVGWDGVPRASSVATYVYDTVADTWAQLANLPDTFRTNPNVWAGNGKLWMTSAFGNAWPYTNKIYSYNITANTWTDETTLFAGMPTTSSTYPFDQLYAGAIIPISSTVVRVVGGSGSVKSWEVDVVAKTFTELDVSLTEPWGYFGGGVYAGTMYVVMGEPTVVYTKAV